MAYSWQVFSGFRDYIFYSISQFGAAAVFLFRLLRVSQRIFTRYSLIVQQMMTIGVQSLPLVMITSLFVGAVTAVQAAYQFMGLVPMKYLGAAVGKAVVIELGPVLTALVVAGRASSSIAAELGTMRVTEQLDALEVMAIDPMEYLILPRVVASIIMLPVLTIFSDLTAIFGGLFVSVITAEVEPFLFIKSAIDFVHVRDLIGGIVKSGIFGFLIAIMGCFYGMKAYGGAEGVGKATTKGVVGAIVWILIANFVLAEIIFNLFFRLVLDR